MEPSSPSSKEKQRQEIAQAMEAFLEAGKTITRLDPKTRPPELIFKATDHGDEADFFLSEHL